MARYLRGVLALCEKAWRGAAFWETSTIRLSGYRLYCLRCGCGTYREAGPQGT